jgi:hypothetical protein
METSGNWPQRFPNFLLVSKKFQFSLLIKKKLRKPVGNLLKPPRPVSGGFQRFPDNPSLIN